MKDPKNKTTLDVTVPESTSLTKVSDELHKLKQPDKEEFFKFLGLNMDNYESFELTPELASKYKRYVKSLKHGSHAATPMICMGGAKCLVGSRCPFTLFDEEGKPDFAASKYPVGRVCPVEGDIIKLHMRDLIEEYGIGPGDTTDIAIISKLATLDVYEFRAACVLGDKAQDMLVKEVSVVDIKTGRAFYTEKIHPSFELIERIHRMKQDLLKSMVATRREKVKAQAALGNTIQKTEVSRTLSELKQKLVELQKEQENEVIEAEYTEVNLDIKNPSDDEI